MYFQILLLPRERSNMQKDLVWSAYYEDPVRFTDVINGLVAAGKLLLEANDFVEKDTKSIPPKMDESGGKRERS